ncbi:glycosyltransferase [Pedobacter sp. HMF7647]|uniref:Glycosyltransferase n=1 Tax=Hufsiella arboris TaxID=2695275 RepID=A0A7K1YCU9_9SPHI|nr:glycosyltransferase [Hufsiella arboris]MXV52395.1 glycosyltransferase [Hufsiella arboris]
MEVLVSVVIPTYKRPELLKRCIESLFIQTLDHQLYELVIVGDGFDSQTKEVVRTWKEAGFANLTYIYLPDKKGPAAARNMGWLSAKAKLIAFTDDDCLPKSTWLQTILHCWNGNEEIACSGKLTVPLSENPSDYELNTANLETAEFITANCICTKAALIKTGGFDERFFMAWREDSDLHFKLLANNITIKKIPEAEVVHPVRTAKWGVSIKEQKKGMFNALLYKKYPKLYKNRIGNKVPLNYYLMVLTFFCFLVCLFFKVEPLAGLSFSIWLLLVLEFFIRRQRRANHSLVHIAEMAVTSAVIPFVSVYWQFYGAVKYRVLFI